MQAKQSSTIFTWLITLEIIAIVIVLLIAIVLQFLLGELPCPLCLLQRVGLFAIAVSLLMNLRFGFKPVHYTFTILFAVYTGFVALRQIALHIVPGTGAYGAAFLGFHLYTWVFIIAVVIIIYAAIILGCNVQYKVGSSLTKWQQGTMYLLFAVVGMLLLTNVVLTIMECGLSQCPDNPIHYLF